MKAKSKLIMVFVIFYLCISSESRAQKISTLAGLGDQAQKLWEVMIPVAPRPHSPTGIIYALLKTGIAVLSPDGQTILCYDFYGKLLWESPGIQTNISKGWLYSTASREYLVLSYPRYEGASTIAVYNAEGELLWRADFPGIFSLSPSDKYLISSRQITGGSMPLTVVEFNTGKVLWQVEPSQGPQRYGHWEAAAGSNDRIAYYNGGVLRLFQLEDGKLLWERSVSFDPANDDGSVHISRMGNVISFDASLGVLRNERRVIYVFDVNGDLLWHKIQPKIPGRSNGGRVKGISAEGEYLAVKDGTKFSIYEINRQREIWTLVESGLSDIRIFTKHMLIFSPPQNTKVITLNEDGTIMQRYFFEQYVDFKYLKPVSSPNLDAFSLQVAPIVVEKKNEQIFLSNFILSFETAH